MIQQTEFSLSAKRRGFLLVTREILSNLPTLPKRFHTGIHPQVCTKKEQPHYTVGFSYFPKFSF